MEGEEEEVQEAEEAGGAARKRKRVGGEDSAELVEAGADDDDAEGAEGGVYGKVLLGEDGDDDDDEGGIAEEAVAEEMRWLEAEIADNMVAAPSSSADAGFVTINGYEESCGPSFSAAASTVMASVDTRVGAPPPPSVPWPWPEPEPQPHPVLPAAPAVDVETGGEPADEEWLVRLLTCGALLEGVL